MGQCYASAICLSYIMLIMYNAISYSRPVSRPVTPSGQCIRSHGLTPSVAKVTLLQAYTVGRPHLPALVYLKPPSLPMGGELF